MSAKILKFLPLLAVVNMATAQTPSPEAAPTTPALVTAPAATPTSGSEEGRYQLKRKSEFNLETRGRAPFWPIGWTKQGAAPVIAQKMDVDEDLFKVTSILVGNPSMAVINGRSYEEGQFIRMPKQMATQLRPRLYRIGDGLVQIQVQNQMMTVQLKRPELNDAKHEPELLNEEKDDLLPVPSKSVKSASSR